jgi:hypothetical protein
MRIFNLNNNPLAWLLKVADVLQEWDKPSFQGLRNEEKLETKLQISFTDSEILVSNFPEGKAEKILEELSSTSCPKIIKFV